MQVVELYQAIQGQLPPTTEQFNLLATLVAAQVQLLPQAASTFLA
jgi:hypothetical protein